MKISQINLETIPDSRGEETIEVVMVSGDLKVTSSVPAGKSKGKLEVFSVASAIALSKLEGIKSEILNSDFSQVFEFDNFLKKLTAPRIN